MDLEAYVKRIGGVAAETFGRVKNDVIDVVKSGQQKINETIDEVVDDEAVKDIGRTIYNNAGKGIEATREALRAKVTEYDQKLNDLSRLKPRSAGFWDGVLNLYLGTEYNRNPTSDAYTSKIKYGKAVGFLTAASLFASGGLIGTLVGAVPVISRTTNYFKKKINESKAEVDEKDKQPPVDTKK